MHRNRYRHPPARFDLYFHNGPSRLVRYVSAIYHQTSISSVLEENILTLYRVCLDFIFEIVCLCWWWLARYWSILIVYRWPLTNKLFWQWDIVFVLYHFHLSIWSRCWSNFTFNELCIIYEHHLIDISTEKIAQQVRLVWPRHWFKTRLQQ